MPNEKPEKSVEVDKLASEFTPRDRRGPREPPLDAMRNELEYRKWEREQRAEMDKVERAYSEQPPGKRLYVQSKTIPQRRRAGILFSNKGRVEVRVVDAEDADIAQAVANGRTVVSPMGAKAIVEDDALIVFEDPGAYDVSSISAERDALAAENAELKSRLAETLRGKRNDPDRVVPDRLANEKGSKSARGSASDTAPDAPTGKDIAGGK